MTDFPLNRSQVLTTLAVGASGLMLPRLVYADTSALIPGSDVCALTPGVTEGPYYLDTSLIRRDITEGRPGVPVHLRLQVVDAACAPVEGARVDLWHCDAQGVYSSFGGDSGQSSARGETFLRGTQIADAQGIVTFDTIYPGWYRGRTTHMHFKVWLDEHTVLTGQIFVPDALSEYLYLNVPAYQREGARDTVNRTDRIAQQATQASFAAVTEEDSAYLVQMIIGVDPMANADTDNDRPPLPPGSRPPADSPMDGGHGASAPLVPGSG